VFNAIYVQSARIKGTGRGKGNIGGGKYNYRREDKKHARASMTGSQRLGGSIPDIIAISN
jgi:hypothetical protein